MNKVYPKNQEGKIYLLIIIVVILFAILLTGGLSLTGRSQKQNTVTTTFTK